MECRMDSLRRQPLRVSKLESYSGQVAIEGCLITSDTCGSSVAYWHLHERYDIKAGISK